MKIWKRRQSRLSEADRVLKNSGSTGQPTPVNDSHSSNHYADASHSLASVETNFKLMSEQHDRMRALVLGSRSLKWF